MQHLWRNVTPAIIKIHLAGVEPLTNLSLGLVLPWQESTTDYVNSIQDAINDAKAKAEDFNSREKVINASSITSVMNITVRDFALFSL